MKNFKDKKFVIFILLSVFVPVSGSFAQSGAETAQSSFIGLLPFVLLFALFYLLIIRPQRKRSAERDKMLKELKRGDSVLTNGGLYAMITDIGEDSITLEIAKGVNVKASVSAVASKIQETPDKKAGG